MGKRTESFDKRMIRFITKALIIATIVILAVSAAITVFTTARQSAEIAQSDAEVNAGSMAENFDDYYNISVALTLDQNIQDYLAGGTVNYANMDNAKRALENVCNMNANINFISLSSAAADNSLAIGGGVPNWLPDYRRRLTEEYRGSTDMGRGHMKMRITDTFKPNQALTLSVYCPVYSTGEIGKSIGTICINVNDANLENILHSDVADQKFRRYIYLTDTAGQVLLGNDEQQLRPADTAVLGHSRQQKNYTRNGLIVYSKIDRWNFYYITRIAYWEIWEGSILAVIILVLLLAVIIYLVVRMSRQMVTAAYRPWGAVVKAMDQVTGGNLQTRLELAAPDADMIVVVKGFNTMMLQMERLIEQVKEEQQQMSQIRLEALHSQIQPHFLYNTLDCIRWQAVAGGSPEVARMIKALAAYYRLCLSKGQDMIRIEKELEYLEHYLYIQKIRYGEILSYQLKTDGGEWLQNYIPKLTLQPLVENAIYHGIKPQKAGGHIEIGGRAAAAGIELWVSDDGVGMSAPEVAELNRVIKNYDENYGYGVRNVNRRLQLYFGEDYGITYSRNAAGGITARIWIPYHAGGEGGNDR